MILPAAYAWVEGVAGAPKMLLEAVRLYGVHEAYGVVDNPAIMAWADELGLEKVYTADAIPWCGLFAALIATRAGHPPPENPLWALNWSKWGQNAGQPCLGDILVFIRPGGGHVGLYIGEDTGSRTTVPCYHVLGGNTADQVGITRIEKTRLQAARCPLWVIAPPAGRRPHILEATGAISHNEA